MSVSQIEAYESWRRPTCSDQCQSWYVQVLGERTPRVIVEHDPDGHESAGMAEFGRVQALTFGRLTVCPRLMAAYLDGRPLPLTKLELLLLCYLAQRAGSVCRRADILRDVWGPEYPRLAEEHWRAGSEQHILTVNISRLRRQLGPMGGLIETRLNIGYLMAAPDTVSDTVPFAGRPATPHAGALQREILECLRSRPGQWMSVESILVWVQQTRPLRHRHHVAMSISRLPIHERAVQVRYRGQYVAAAMLSERSL